MSQQQYQQRRLLAHFKPESGPEIPAHTVVNLLEESGTGWSLISLSDGLKHWAPTSWLAAVAPDPPSLVILPGKSKPTTDDDGSSDAASTDSSQNNTPAKNHSSTEFSSTVAASGAEPGTDAFNNAAGPAAPVSHGTSDDDTDDDDDDEEERQLQEQSAQQPGMESFFARAVFDFEAEDEDELALKSGDVIRVVFASDSDWWTGCSDGKIGHFPSSYVRRLDSADTTGAGSGAATDSPHDGATGSGNKRDAAAAAGEEDADVPPPLPPKRRQSHIMYRARQPKPSSRSDDGYDTASNIAVAVGSALGEMNTSSRRLLLNTFGGEADTETSTDDVAEPSLGRDSSQDAPPPPLPARQRASISTTVRPTLGMGSDGISHSTGEHGAAAKPTGDDAPPQLMPRRATFGAASRKPPAPLPAELGSEGPPPPPPPKSAAVKAKMESQQQHADAPPPAAAPDKTLATVGKTPSVPPKPKPAPKPAAKPGPKPGVKPKPRAADVVPPPRTSSKSGLDNETARQATHDDYDDDEPPPLPPPLPPVDMGVDSLQGNGDIDDDDEDDLAPPPPPLPPVPDDDDSMDSSQQDFDVSIAFPPPPPPPVVDEQGEGSAPTNFEPERSPPSQSESGQQAIATPYSGSTALSPNLKPKPEPKSRPSPPSDAKPSPGSVAKTASQLGNALAGVFAGGGDAASLRPKPPPKRSSLQATSDGDRAATGEPGSAAPVSFKLPPPPPVDDNDGDGSVLAGNTPPTIKLPPPPPPPDDEPSTNDAAGSVGNEAALSQRDAVSPAQQTVEAGKAEPQVQMRPKKDQRANPDARKSVLEMLNKLPLSAPPPPPAPEGGESPDASHGARAGTGSPDSGNSPLSNSALSSPEGAAPPRPRRAAPPPPPDAARKRPSNPRKKRPQSMAPANQAKDPHADTGRRPSVVRLTAAGPAMADGRSQDQRGSLSRAAVPAMGKPGQRTWSLSSDKRRTSMDTRVYLAKDPAARLLDDLQHLRPQLAGWRGSDGSTTTLSLIHHSQLMKVSKGKAQCRSVFLFDNVLVYAKREKGKLDVKGTLALNETEIRDLKDGQEKLNGAEVCHAWKVRNLQKDKWYILYAASAEQKQQWIMALNRERQIAQESQSMKTHVIKITRSSTHGFGFDLSEDDGDGNIAACHVVNVSEPTLCPGLQIGDFLWQLNGMGISKMRLQEVINLLYMIQPDTWADLVVQRR